MQHLIKLTDKHAQYLVLLTVSDLEASQPASDIVFDVIGTEDIERLVEAKVISEGQVDDLKALQQMIFDNDSEGRFIRNGTNFTANGQDLDPDANFNQYFVIADNNGVSYNKCDLVVSNEALPLTASLGTKPDLEAAAGAATAMQSAAASQSTSPEAVTLSYPAGTSSAATSANEEDPMHSYAMILLIHQLRIGRELDVTKDWPDLERELAECEKLGLIEIDVKAASYRLTPAGKALHKKYLEEAQDLIRRYDIFCDVSVDSSGIASFDTGVGKDLRVPVYEMEGLDPFRARFLLGINDGEWDNLVNWYELLKDRKWYDQVFIPIEKAPAVEEVGEDKLRSIINQAQSILVEQLQGASKRD